MGKKPGYQRLELSQSACKVSELLQTMADGNQREFSKLLGCAQPVISRIVNGKQEPGPELLARIAEIEGSTRQELQARVETRQLRTRLVETMVPIARCLLSGPPGTRPEHLTTNTVALASAVYRPALYAVAARACEPAFSIPVEQMRAEDLVIIDSAVERLTQNLQGLNKKLCVIRMRDKEGDSITLRRVWIKYVAESSSRGLLVCSDAKVDEFRAQMFEGRMLRSIQLDPEVEPENKFIDRLVNVEDIVGVAIQLIRCL